MRKKLFEFWARWRTPLTLAFAVMALGPVFAFAAEVAAAAPTQDYAAVGEAAKKLLALAQTPIGMGADSVALYTVLENFVMPLIPSTNNSLKMWVALGFNLLAFLIPGLAAGTPLTGLLMGSLSFGGSTLVHEITKHLGTFGTLAGGVVSNLGPKPVTPEQVLAWKSKGNPLAAQYNDDGTVKVSVQTLPLVKVPGYAPNPLPPK